MSEKPHTALCFNRKGSPYIEFLNRNCPLVGSFVSTAVSQKPSTSLANVSHTFSRLAFPHFSLTGTVQVV